jgi:hypothetical protein
MILLSGEVIVFLFLEGLLLLLLAGAAVGAAGILRRWDFQATDTRQYRLEKRAYLVTLIILFALAAKILLLPFFAYTIDRLAALVPGAMCGAGVLGANGFGGPLLLLKVAVLALAGTWLLVNREDLAAPDYPFLRAKLWLFLAAWVLVVAETVLDLLYLTRISTLSPVQCCSLIYGVAGPGPQLPLGLDTRLLLILFYLVAALALVAGLARLAVVAAASSAGLLFFGYHAVVDFFGTYVYQLPTHRCPFCMLQPEYHLVGYLIWGSLFGGAFFGVAAPLLRWLLGRHVALAWRGNVILVTVFVLVCSLYVGVYYLRNGVFL